MVNPTPESVNPPEDPPDALRQVNCKGVSTRAWERSRAAAKRNGEPHGAWITRAINALADADRAPREINIRAKEAELHASVQRQVEALMSLMAAMGQFSVQTGRPPSRLRVSRIYRACDEARQLLVALPVIENGKSPLYNRNLADAAEIKGIAHDGSANQAGVEEESLHHGTGAQGDHRDDDGRDGREGVPVLSQRHARAGDD